MILDGYMMHRSLTANFSSCNVISNRRSLYDPSIHASIIRKQNLTLAHGIKNIPPLRGSYCLGSSWSLNLSLGRQYTTGELRMPVRNERAIPRSKVISCASKRLFTEYPKMTSRPKWWWRAFACFPYLLPLHKLWMHADSVYHLHKLLESWEFLVNPFIDTLVTMPSWLFMAVLYCLYFFVVKKKECPHFLRFHLVMAMLLENVYEAMAIACRWLPKTTFRGDLGMHFWLAVTLAQLYTLVECMRCALTGKYADAPFVSDAAYLHTDPNLLPS